jgi:hypothetical protein
MRNIWRGNLKGLVKVSAADGLFFVNFMEEKIVWEIKILMILTTDVKRDCFGSIENFMLDFLHEKI